MSKLTLQLVNNFIHKIVNLFARVSMKLEGNFKELEVYILFILVSL